MHFGLWVDIVILGRLYLLLIFPPLTPEMQLLLSGPPTFQSWAKEFDEWGISLRVTYDISSS